MRNIFYFVWLAIGLLTFGCKGGDSSTAASTDVPSEANSKEAIQKIAEKNRDLTVDEQIGKAMVQYLGILGNDSLEKVVKMQTTETGLKYIINNKGKEYPPIDREMVSVQYYGMLTDGTKFDSSFERMDHFTFKVGMGDVIKGWDEGIKLIGQGGNIVLFVPPTLGYGTKAMGPIPPNSYLIFFINLDRIYR